MEKRKIIRSIENLTEDVIEALKSKYPDGWSNHVIKVSKGNNEFFHAITVDTDNACYLVKVNVKVDSKTELEKEEDQQHDKPDEEETVEKEEIDEDSNYNED